MNGLTPRDREMFARFHIPEELLQEAGVRRVNDAEAREVLGLNGRAGDMSGLLFPYRSPQTGFRVAARVRRDNPEYEEGKPKNKYLSGYGDRRHLYFVPHAAEMLSDTAVPAVLVEAEKSALALRAWSQRTGKKILPVALGGCWGWRGRIGKVENANGERVDEVGPLPDLSCCANRRVYILLDANLSTNSLVKAARRELVKTLRKMGAKVHSLDLPGGDGINGPDDFVATKGDAALSALFESKSSASVAACGFTEDGLALHFADLYEADLRYVFLWNKWLRYTGAWAQDVRLAVFNRSRTITREASMECSEKQNGIAKWLRSAATVAAVVRLAQSDPRIAAVPEQFDTDPWLFNTSAGTVELKSGTIREHRAEDYITKITNVAPQVTDCPLWDGFLDRITAGDVKLQHYLQRMSGYCLTGVTKEEAMFFFHGTGGNGKGTFLKTLQGIMGDYAQTTSIETLTEQKNDRHPCDLAALRGARLVVSSETEQGQHWAESRIKLLTGSDPVTARFMRGDFFEYVPQFKLIIQGNHKPSLRSVNQAIKRRMQMVPFTVTISEEECDQDLKDKLIAEYPAILQWAIDGCVAWQEQGLNPPQSVVEATKEYLESEDSMGRWLEERCIVSPQAGTGKSSALYADFKGWAERVGEFCGSQKRFSQNLKDRGFVIRESHGKVVDGIKLREKDEQ